MDPMISSNTGSIPAIQKTNVHKGDIEVDNLNPQSVAQITALSGTNRQQQTIEDTVQQLQKAIDAIQGPPRTLEFSIHEKTNAIMIKVLNKETGDLIREVPPEKILDLAARMMEITGIIVDKKV